MKSSQYIGTSINGYTITQFLGAGGMGEVYRAEHPVLRRTAAIKLLFESSQTARFQNEAYIQSSVRHPNIAGMYEYCVYDSKPCIIMEFVEGITLDKYIQQKGRLKNEELLNIFKQLTEAIAHLHKNQIIHRDIKPSNIKISNNGNVKLLDFGISKATYTPKLTQQGFVVGTTEYMAPEQFKHEVSLKSDIWALGVLFYEISTGYMPFEEKSYLLIRQKIEKGIFTNPQLLNPNLSNSLNEIISKCLKNNPIQRPSAQQILDFLGNKKGTDNPSISLDFIRNKLNFFKNKSTIYTIAAVLLITIVWAIIPDRKEEEIIEKNKKIKIEVANFDNAELVLPDGTVMKNKPFILDKPTDKKLEFQIRLGDFTKSYSIEANYPDSTFKCDLDVF